ncbi:MAG: type VI secretion system-associated FHA domain protein TagH [Gammaproteobacteria bacterium]|jgi:type VI secretion system FHA domain protein|nr:type VI secretion system-associated FHA domain protein TagH [Gammaproteobacteria bacterium]
MPLKLTIIQQPEGGTDAVPVKYFEQCGGVLGREPDNDWVLPHKYVSRRHAEVRFAEGRYYVCDTSQNGVYLNGRLVGQGNSVVLTDGDRVAIGDYEILVQTDLVAPPSITPPETPSTPYGAEAALGLDAILPQPAAPELPWSAAAASGARIPEPPPGAHFPWGEAPRSGGGALHTESDVLPAVNQPFRAPGAVEEIPENWWEEAAPAPAHEAMVRPPAPVLREPVPHAVPQPPPVAPPAPPHPGTALSAGLGAARPITPREPVGGGALAALLAGAGLPPSLPPGTSEAQVLELAGALLHELVRGTMELLAARASIKQEARLEVTTLRPVENNPLKFAASLDDALARLLSPEPGQGFLEPKRAVRDAMQDLRAHELATMAGLEAAVREMFNRFDPERLERDFSERSLLASILPAHRKAKCWDLFAQQFRQIAEEAREDFNALFGREFARAYEEQVRRLRSAGTR